MCTIMLFNYCSIPFQGSGMRQFGTAILELMMRRLQFLIFALTALILVQACLVLSDDEQASHLQSDPVYGHIFNYKDDSDEDIMHIRRMMSQLHLQQHPPKESCRLRRLLVLQSISSFEGLGSVLKLLMLGLAEAAHSNRTLIWGPQLPYLLEYTRSEWFDKEASAGKRSVTVKGFDLDCGSYGRYDGSGSYACFFQQLSSCSLADVSYEEMKLMTFRGHSDEFRIRIQEERRAPAAYHLPVHNPLFTDMFKDKKSASKSKSNTEKIKNARHKWAGAVAAYIFRLKPDVVEIFEEKRLSMWPRHLGGRGQDTNCQAYCPGPESGMDGESEGEPVWGFHIRHGDLKAYQSTYVNRQLYEFNDYLSAARTKARELIDIGQYSKLPAAVYVASDSMETPEFVKKACTGVEAFQWLITEDPNHEDYYEPPCVFSANPEDRFRTAHGSHTVLGAGSCPNIYKENDTDFSCALEVNDMAFYKKHGEMKDVPIGKRLMISFFEALEDLYMLSYMDYFIGTLSSHFSSQAALLVLARAGGNPDSIHYLDNNEVKSGFLECTYFLFVMRPTIEPHEGLRRWAHHTRRFLEGVTIFNVNTNINYTVGEEPQYRLRLIDQLPFMPQKPFSMETARWMGKSSAPVWPGECDADISHIPQKMKNRQDFEDALDNVIMLVNLGVDQNKIHPNQAVICWTTAMKILQLIEKNAVGKFEDYETKTREQYMEYIKGNLGAVAIDPYKRPDHSLLEFFEKQYGPDFF